MRETPRDEHLGRAHGSGKPESTSHQSAAYQRWLDNLPWAQMRQRYEAGESINSIAADYDVHVQTVRSRFIKMDVPMRRGRKPQQLPVSDKRLRRDYANGRTVASLAEEHGVSITTIWRHLKLGPGTATGSRPTTHTGSAEYRRWVNDLDWEQIAFRYMHGETLTALADSLGVSHPTVWAHIKTRVPMRPKKQPATIAATAKQLAAAHAAGVSYSELARRHQTRPATIKRRIQTVTTTQLPKAR